MKLKINKTSMKKKVKSTKIILEKKINEKNKKEGSWKKRKVLLKKKRKKRKKGKVEKKREKVKKKNVKKKRNAMWITVVIHNAFGCAETVISPHHLIVCIMFRVIIRIRFERLHECCCMTTIFSA